MTKSSKMINRQDFGLAPNPWPDLTIDTQDMSQLSEITAACIKTRAMVSVIGARGSGKTYALRRAFDAQDTLVIVEPLRLTRDKLHMGDIENALIRDLSDERPRRSGEARSHQVRRILGEAQKRHEIVLYIDDAHILHHSTLRALKRLRELSWLNKAPLLSIVLVGQFDKTASIAEVGLRSDSLHLNGLTPAEIKHAVQSIFSDKITQDALRAVSKIKLAANWLNLQNIMDACIATALARGAGQIDEDIVAAISNPAQNADIPRRKRVDKHIVTGVLEQHTQAEHVA